VSRAAGLASARIGRAAPPTPAGRRSGRAEAENAPARRSPDTRRSSDSPAGDGGRSVGSRPGGRRQPGPARSFYSRRRRTRPSRLWPPCRKELLYMEFRSWKKGLSMTSIVSSWKCAEVLCSSCLPPNPANILSDISPYPTLNLLCGTFLDLDLSVN